MFGLILWLIIAVIVIGGIVLAERSLRRQRGSGIRRTPEEDRHIGHAWTTFSRSGGSGGGF
jgi:hypothetical protein